jgi:hypothetical protein
MSDNLKILRKATSWADMQPGEWFIDNALADAEGRTGANRVSIRCPKCKNRSWLNKAHRVDAQGHVTASVLCCMASCGDGIARCDWHEYITLLDWTPVEGI